MISLPLPFVVALLLGVVVARRDAGRELIVLFLGACVAVVIVVGLRWSSGLPVFRFLQPVLAALLPSLAWLCFSSRQGARRGPVWPYLSPAALVLALLVIGPRWRDAVDALLVVLYFGFGTLLFYGDLAGAGRHAAVRESDGLRGQGCRDCRSVAAVLRASRSGHCVGFPHWKR
ncbi:hypothetical protein [Breoghania sp.]|uniref:hypothetical protein n=1 Tax=Breoghania sp. TaxID=2065378 RepID=UPI00260333B1|nr:hypothetical protein [Breoghania sp.]MDJ0931119.1 hypothetical protein [Breoghania sp.]